MVSMSGRPAPSQGGGQVGRNADVLHNAHRVGAFQRLQRAAGGDDAVKILRAGVVELVQLDVVGAQAAQAGVQLLGHLLGGDGAAFGGDDKFIPQTALLQSLADPFLADSVRAGGVDVVDAGLVGSLQQLARPGLVDALHRDAAKAQPGDLQSRGPQ